MPTRPPRRAGCFSGPAWFFYLALTLYALPSTLLRLALATLATTALLCRLADGCAPGRIDSGADALSIAAGLQAKAEVLGCLTVLTLLGFSSLGRDSLLRIPGVVAFLGALPYLVRFRVYQGTLARLRPAGTGPEPALALGAMLLVEAPVRLLLALGAGALGAGTGGPGGWLGMG